MGFKCSQGDSHMIIYIISSTILILHISMHDILVTGHYPYIIQETIVKLNSFFTLKGLRDLNSLGMEVTRKHDSFHLCQQLYV